jgi:hypothetical protein
VIAVLAYIVAFFKWRDQGFPFLNTPAKDTALLFAFSLIGLAIGGVLSAFLESRAAPASWRWPSRPWDSGRWK